MKSPTECIPSTDVLSSHTTFTSLIPSQLIKSTGAIQQQKKTTHWGHNLEAKGKNTLRIYFQNIHGIKLGEDSSDNWIDIQDKFKEMDNISADIFGWAETNVAWDPSLINNAKHHARNIFKQAHIKTCSISEPSIRKHQMGGTMITATGKTTGRVIDSGVDPSGLGRWSYICLTGKNGRKLYVASAYRVGANDKGENTAYQQQVREMRKKGVDRPNPRKQWLTDMTHQIQQWKKDGEVLLAVDINSPLLDRDISKFLADTGLCDVLGATHGAESPNTHIKGSQTIDFLFATPAILDALERCGMLNYHDGIISDHRALWIDLNVLRLLRGEIHEINPRPQKQIHTKHIKRSKEFKKKVMEAMEARNLEERTNEAVNNKEVVESEDLQKLMQELDKEVDDCILEAERTMQPIPAFWWSDTLYHAHLLVKYWSGVISLIRNNMDAEEARSDLAKGIPSDIDIHQGDVARKPTGQLRKALKHRRECRNNSFQLRQEFLERLAEEEAEEGNASKEAILRRMKEAEASRRMYRRLKNYLKPEDRSGLTHIMVPDVEAATLLISAHLWTSGKAQTFQEAVVLSYYFLEVTPMDKIAKVIPHRRVTIKEEMDANLLKHHKAHFNQAKGTPFTVEPLSSLVDFNASTQFCEDLRNGEAEIDSLDVDDDTKDYLREIQTLPTDPPQIDTTYGIKHVIDGFKIWNESTSTSPLGRYLSLYKVWIGKKGSVDKAGRKFFTIILNILLLAMRLSEPLKRWATVHNLFLLKAAGDYRVGRLRTIHKIDAELNGHRREFVARRLLRHAERYNHLSDEQYGGRYGRTASDATFLTALTTEAFTLQRSNAALTDCDAKACYDRILPQLVSLTSHKAGLPYPICRLYTRTLESMEYVMITGYGESEERNKSTEDSVIYGPGQGAADAPGDWTLISNTNTKCYNKKALGCKIHDPPKRRVIRRNADLFVDDVKLLHNGGRFNITEQQLKYQVEQDSTLWGRILWISGGLLEFDKSTYTIILWKFEPSGKPTLTKEEDLTGDDVIIDINGEKTTLKYTDSTIALKMLGVRQAGNQQSDTEHTFLMSKAVKFSAAITACPLKKHEVNRGYMSVYLPSMKYSLAATCLTTKQCEAIDDIVLPHTARRMGFSNGFPSAVITAPTYFGGMGLQTTEGEQAVEKITATIKHTRAQHQPGLLFLITLGWAQLQAGVSQSILENPRRFMHLEGRWINTLIEYLTTINGQIHLADPWIQLPMRENDRFIMEGIMDCPHIDASWHSEINYVRMYLRATTLADITTSDGTTINECILQSDACRLESTITWPQQERPYKQAWKKWRVALHRAFCLRDLHLQEPLGEWLEKPSISRWYSKGGKSIYCCKNNEWEVWPISKMDRKHMYFNRSYPCTKPFGPLLPVTDFTSYKDMKRCTMPTALRKTTSDHQTPDTFQSYVETLPQWEAQLLQNLISTTGYLSLATAVELDEDIWLVTDGGQDGSDGYFGWVIATNSRILWRGGGYVQGNEDLMESLRTESMSLLSMLRFLFRYCEFHNITIRPDKTAHFCDNLALVRRTQWISSKPCTTPSECLLADYDIQLQIEATLRDMGLTLQCTHVKGHQDDKIPIEKLKWEAQLNVKADELATRAKTRTTIATKNAPFSFLPACKSYLIINGKVITRQIQREVRTAWYTPALRKHLQTKFKWSASTVDDIDWEACGRIRTGHDFYMRQFTVRFTFERLPLLGAKYVGATDRTCPVCKKTDETHDHFLQCPENPENTSSIALQLRRIFIANNIDPALRILITAAVSQQSIGRAKLKNKSINWDNYKTLIYRQAALGWKQILYGRLSLAWEAHQKRYEEDMGLEVASFNPWIGQMVSTIWRGIRLRWKARNSALHTKGDNQYELQKETLLRRISNLYNEEQNVLAQDRGPFERPLEDWATKSVTDMRQWLTINQPFITHCVKLREKQDTMNTRDIRSYGTCKKPTQPPGQKPRPHRKDKKTHRQESILTFARPAMPDTRPTSNKTYKFRRRETETKEVAPMAQSKLWEHFSHKPKVDTRSTEE